MKTKRKAVQVLNGVLIVVVIGVLPVAALADQPKASEPTLHSIANARAAYGHLPLNFEANQRQTDSRVKFISRGDGYNLFLTSTEAVLVLKTTEGVMVHAGEAEESGSSNKSRQAVVRMGLVGANTLPKIYGLNAL